MKKEIQVGLLGLGTVGAGTVQVLQDHAEEIEARLGFPLRLKTVYSRNIQAKDTSWIRPEVRLATRVDDILEDTGIDIVVEVIGGIEPAKSIIMRALHNKKSVVTANKFLLARYGSEIIEAARLNNVALGVEASVAGGIPILRVIQEGLVGERIRAVYGILNGTANYILGEIERSGRSLNEALKEAQALGYAEVDPTRDLEGLDARDKLAILAMMCFGERTHYKGIAVAGITRITPIDFRYAHGLGCTIKLIAAGRRLPSGNLALSVQPALIPRASILAKVDGAFNAIMIHGAKSGESMYYGRGAGGAPTGIAIVSDIVGVARNLASANPLRTPPLSYHEFEEPQWASKEEFQHAYYLRFTVRDRPGIIERLAHSLARFGINIHAVFQEPYPDKQNLPFVITVEKTSQDRMERALRDMDKLEFLTEPPLLLQFDDLTEDG